MAKQTGLQTKKNADVSAFLKPVPEAVVVKPKQKRRPTDKQIRAAKLLAENVRNPKPKSKGEILKEAGYSTPISESPSKVLDSPVMQDLLEEFMPDSLLAETHKRLLTTRKIEHMVFPLMTDEAEESLLNEGQTLNVTDGETLTDADIVLMLDEVGCKVKKIMHSETARHVWYWSHDAKAQAAALDLAYKMKGHMGKDGGGVPNVFALFGNNTMNFVQKGEGKS